MDGTGLVKFASGDNTVNAITLDAGFNGGGIVLTSGAQGIFLTSNGGPIGIGAWSGGDIFLGTAAVARNVIIGNNTGASTLFNRFGTGGLIRHQEPDVALADADATLTIGQVLAAIFTIAPTATRTLTLPTAALAVAGVPAPQIGDAIDFTIINTDATNIAVLAPGTGGSIVGNPNVEGAASGNFRLRFTNVTGGTEAYTVYRL